MIYDLITQAALIIDNSNVLSGIFVVVTTIIAAKFIFLTPRFRVEILAKPIYENQQSIFEFFIINTNKYTIYGKQEAYVSIFLPEEFYSSNLTFEKNMLDDAYVKAKLSQEFITIKDKRYMGNIMPVPNSMFPNRKSCLIRAIGIADRHAIQNNTFYFTVSTQYGTFPRKLNESRIKSGLIPKCKVLINEERH